MVFALLLSLPVYGGDIQFLLPHQDTQRRCVGPQCNRAPNGQYVCPDAWGAAGIRRPEQPIYYRPSQPVRQTSPTQVIAHSQAPVVVLIRTISPNNEFYVGSGTIIASDGKVAGVLTANHVVSHPGRIQVHVPGKGPYSAHVERRDEPSDLALLLLQCPGVPPIIIEDKNMPQVGDVVAGVGYGPNGVYKNTKGTIRRFVKRTDAGPDDPGGLMWFDGLVRQGDSGGPILNEHGYMVGVISTGGHGATVGACMPRMCGIFRRLAWRRRSVVRVRTPYGSPAPDVYVGPNRGAPTAGTVGYSPAPSIDVDVGGSPFPEPVTDAWTNPDTTAPIPDLGGGSPTNITTGPSCEEFLGLVERVNDIETHVENLDARLNDMQGVSEKTTNALVVLSEKTSTVDKYIAGLHELNERVTELEAPVPVTPDPNIERNREMILALANQTADNMAALENQLQALLDRPQPSVDEIAQQAAQYVRIDYDEIAQIFIAARPPTTTPPAATDTGRILYFTARELPGNERVDARARELKDAGVPITIITLRPEDTTLAELPRVYVIDEGKDIRGRANVVTYLSFLTRP
jgi:hypothetical protein